MNPQSPIRVLLVDDSPLVLQDMKRLLSKASEIQVVGVAANGLQALELVNILNPDVICTDLHISAMDGLEFIKEVMARYPRPILVVSDSVEHGSPNVFRLLEAGDVDFYPKSRVVLNGDLDKLSHELVDKIRILAGVRVFRRNIKLAAPMPQNIARIRPTAAPRIVSTGGPQALYEILGNLPASFPLPIVCVQHIGSSFLCEMIIWLSGASALPLRNATAGEIAQPGVVYFPPEDTHLEWDDLGRFAYSNAPSIDGHRPSVTATMKSAARSFGAGSLGVLLTGMGSDGANGMANINAAGGITIAQDENSCVVYGMPKQAVELGAVQHILPLEKISQTLQMIARGRLGME